MFYGLKNPKKVSEILTKLNEGKISLSYAAEEFWSFLAEFYEQAPEILAQIRPEITYKLIRAGLSSADLDMFRLAEKNIWFREKVGSVIRSLSKEELEEVSKAILRSGLDRSAIASRIFYRYKKLRK